MNQFFTSLTPLQKKFFYVAVFFVTLALFDVLLVSPSNAKRVKIEEETKSAEEAIKGDLKILSYQSKVDKEKELFKPYYSDSIPKDEEVMSQFLGKLDSYVKEFGLTLTKNNRSNDQAEESADAASKKDYLTYKADLECSGNLEDIAKLLYKIDTSKEFFKILKINLAMKKTGDVEEMKAVMTVAKYIFPSDPELLKDSTASIAKK
ncbi:MAG: hypothetical protein JNN05_03445 [Candidatus Omnitrophica bacterium]|nr:hypothetical protein [Candidatus Omnitrophota bacterium]